MKNRRLIKLIAVLLVVMSVMVMAIPVFAGPPEHISDHVVGEYTIAQCDGFDIIDAYDGDWRETIFFEKDGVTIHKTIYHATMHDRIYNSVTGYEVTNVFVYNETYYPDPDNPEDDWYQARGHEFNITVPGYGVVLADMGNRIKNADYEIIWSTGNFSEDTERICAAMDQSP